MIQRRFFGSIPTAFLVLISVLMFEVQADLDWPNEENYKQTCADFHALTPDDLIQEGLHTYECKKTVTEKTTSSGVTTTREKIVTGRYNSNTDKCESTGVDSWIPSLSDLNKSKAERFKEACDRFEKKEDKLAEIERDLSKQKRELDQSERERVDRINQEQQQACKGEHRNFVSERGEIEEQVKRNERQIDDLRDRITKSRTQISEAEQNLVERIRRLQQSQRDILQEHQENLDRSEIESQNALNQLETQVLIKINEMERLTNGRNLACNNRFNQYDLVREECYNGALAEVSKKRNEYYKNLYSGDIKFQTASDVFSQNLKTVEQGFLANLQGRQQKCYNRFIGETEIVPCTLKALKARDVACRGKRASNCPTPRAIVIENELSANLSDIEAQEKRVQLELDTLYKQLEEVPVRKAKAAERLKQRLENQQQKFQEEYVSLIERLENERIRTQNEINQMNERIQRLQQSNPALHFKEQLEYAIQQCCAPAQQVATQDPIQMAMGSFSLLNSTECNQIQQYAQDINRNQFIYAQPTPSHRKAIIRSSSSTR